MMRTVWALLDSGSTINAVTPEFIKASCLDVGPLSDLIDGTLKISGFGRLFSQPFGYVIIMVQVEGVQQRPSCLTHPRFNCLPVTLGTPTINQIMNVIKESKIDELSVSLNESRISCLLAGY